MSGKAKNVLIPIQSSYTSLRSLAEFSKIRTEGGVFFLLIPLWRNHSRAFSSLLWRREIEGWDDEIREGQDMSERGG